MAPHMKKATKRERFNTSQFHSDKSADHYERYFKRPIFVEHFVDQSLMEDELLLHVPLPNRWQDITLFDNVVQVEAVHLFYANVQSPDWMSLSFDIVVHRVDIHINPNFIATFLCIQCPAGQSVPYPPQSLNKDIVALLGYS